MVSKKDVLKEKVKQTLIAKAGAAIPGLAGITYEEGIGLTIGAAATVRAVETSAVVRAKYPVLAYAASTLASIQIRNLATVAGNICRASPSADMPPALLVLDAAVVLAGPAGERVVPLAEFFTDNATFVDPAWGRIDGKDTEEIVRMGISYVPEGREVFEELTVRENLAMGAYLRKDRIGVKDDFDLIWRDQAPLPWRSTRY